MVVDTDALAAAIHDARGPLQGFSGLITMMGLYRPAAELKRLEPLFDRVDALNELVKGLYFRLQDHGQMDWEAFLQESLLSIDRQCVELDDGIKRHVQISPSWQAREGAKKFHARLSVFDAALGVLRRTVGDTGESGDPKIKHLLRPVLETIRIHYLDAARNRSLDLQCTCPDGIHVLARRRPLLTVLSNLVGNAVKYTDAGRIDVTACYDQGRVLIAVNDTGIGMDKATLRSATAFRKRGASQAVQARSGEGIGLHSASNSADVLGTKLVFQSELGIGTTASFSLESGVADPLPSA